MNVNRDKVREGRHSFVSRFRRVVIGLAVTWLLAGGTGVWCVFLGLYAGWGVDWGQGKSGSGWTDGQDDGRKGRVVL